MGVFDGIADVSGTIKIEGEKISVDFLPSVPEAGKGTVSWNIPTPLAGCDTASNINSAYCGIVVTLDTKSTPPGQAPVDGTRYTGDPTADADLHAGDTIGDALVIGAFYEPDKKAAGEPMTTSFVVDGVGDEFYFVTVYAVDCQGRYHTDGIRAYSDDYGNPDQPDNPSLSAVVMNDGDGVLPTDGTGLEAGRTYGFEFDLNENFPADSGEDNRITISFDGEDAPTYADLLDVINDQLSDVDNPVRSATPPNDGAYAWDAATSTLTQSDGTSYSEVPDYVVGTTDPATTFPGMIWFDENTNILKVRNAGDTAWDELTTIIQGTDPQVPACDQLWYSDVLQQAYKWSGTTWCELQTFMQPLDPSARKVGVCGQYWYNEDQAQLYRYDVKMDTWEEKTAIFWPQAPDALQANTLWYNDVEKALRIRVVSGAISNWNLIMEPNFVIGEVTPVVAPNLYWYKESTETLSQWDGTTFVELDFLAWPEDPTSITSCELWWNSDDDKVYEWDSLNNEWDEVVKFEEATIDPLTPETIQAEAIWHDTTANVVKQWNGSFFDEITDYIDFPADPTLLDPSPVTAPTILDVAWIDPVNKKVYIHNFIDGVNGPLPIWNEVTPISSLTDPAAIPAGFVWFDENTNELKIRGPLANWVSVPYTTSQVANKVDELWYDLTDDVLKTWNGTAWVPAKPKVEAAIDARGNIVFTSRATGPCASLLMLVPGQDYQRNAGFSSPVTQGGSSMHSGGFKHVYSDQPFTEPRYLNANLREDEFLFNTLPAEVQPVVLGTDGVKGTPSYDQIGIGTDGSPDERRELMHSVRVQLGWPVIDVELTDEQLDTCITGAFESLRKRSDIAYKRNFYLLDIRPGFQNYVLTNSKIGFDRIVTIMAANRRSGAFAGGYSTNSVFDQLFSQQLFGSSSVGGFDMTSLYLSQQYLELIEMMFATRLQYHWDEASRTLSFHQDFHKEERILLDTMIERTEQDLLKDRWVKSWIERFTLGGARLILAEIRGKYAALPGAAGGTSLNAADLLSTSAADFAECYQQLEEYVASNSEQLGAWDFVIG